MTLNTIDSSRLEDGAKLSNLPNDTIQELSLKEDKANKGVANGYAPLDATGKVPSANLPSTGSGDMLKATYDPENGARQVAFKDSVQTALNAKQDTLGFTPENVANKDTDTTLSANSDTKYPSQKATKAYVDTGLSTKQDTLVSGTNIKTVNGEPILGAGGLVLDADDISDTTTVNKFTNSTEKATWNAKQDLLVSGTNLSTINGNSLLIGGNLEISATGGGSGVQSNAYLTNLTSTVVPAYKQTSYSADATETLVSATVNNNTVLMQSYIFDLPLEVTSIPAGTWSFNVSAYVSSATGVTTIRVDTYKRTAGGVETLLFSASTPEINNTTKQTLPPITSTQPAFTPDPTGYIVTKISATTTANTNITVTYAVGDGSATYFNTPLPLRAPQVRFNPTTDITSTNVQTAIEEVYSESVHLTGNQTIADIKTFSSSPIVPTPTTNLQASTKEYVDVGLATKVPTPRTITINGTTYDLTADRSWTISGGGLSWGATISGTSGTGITSTISNSATTGTVGYSGIIGDTQTGAMTLISLVGGASAQGHKLINLSLPNPSTYSRGIVIDLSTTGTGLALNAKKGTNFEASIMSGGLTYDYYTRGNIGSKAPIYYARDSASSSICFMGESRGTAMYLYSPDATNNGSFQVFTGSTGVNDNPSLSFRGSRSGALQSNSNYVTLFDNQRTNTSASSTLVDSFDLFQIKRTSIQTGAGGTFTSTGSVLRIDNIATQTAGTLIDSTSCLRLIQSNNSTGGHILFNSYTGAPTIDGTLWFDGTNLKIRVSGTSYTLTKS